MENSQIEVVTMETKYFIGVPVTNVFQRFDKETMKRANKHFLERKNEIKRVINEQEYVCPHFANDILFTYIYCMEVEDILQIPEGMIGFQVPSQKYIKVKSSDQDPYAISQEYMKENGFEKNVKSLALEIFKFGEEQHFNNAVIYIPIVES